MTETCSNVLRMQARSPAWIACYELLSSVKTKQEPNVMLGRTRVSPAFSARDSSPDFSTALSSFFCSADLSGLAPRLSLSSTK